MDVKHKKSSKELKLMMSSLSSLILVKYGVEFKDGERSDQVLAMLQWASKSEDSEVHALLVCVGMHLGSVHKRFFETNGINFEPFTKKEPKKTEITYRGKTLSKEAATEPKKGENPNKGKKKIVYRGQEKWV